MLQADAFHLFGGANLTAGPGGKPVRRYLRDAYRFTPQAGWRRIADVPRPVVAAPSPAPSIGQSHLFICSGDDGTKVNFQPQAEHPGFPADILAYHTITDTWITLGEMPSPRVTTPAAPWRGRWMVPSGEIRPGVSPWRRVFVQNGLETENGGQENGLSVTLADPTMPFGNRLDGSDPDRRNHWRCG